MLNVFPNKCIPRFLIPSILFLFLTAHVKAAFNIDGEFTVNVFQPGMLQSQAPYVFSVKLFNDGWIFKTTNLKTKFSTERCYYAKEKTFYTVYNDDKFRNTRVKNVGVVQYGEFPIIDGAHTEVLWLAFASGSYFKAKTNSMIVPVWPMSPPTMIYSNDCIFASWTISDTFPWLPLKVEYYDNGTNDAGIQNATKQKKALYIANKSTNVAGSTLPCEFAFLRYQQDSGSSNFVRESVLGKVIYVDTNDLKNVTKPEYVGLAQIHDTRFDDYKSNSLLVTYQTNNGVWLEKEQLSREFKEAKESIDFQLAHNEKVADRKATLQKSQRLFMVVVLLAGIPIIIVVFKILKAGRANRK